MTFPNNRFNFFEAITRICIYEPESIQIQSVASINVSILRNSVQSRVTPKTELIYVKRDREQRYRLRCWGYRNFETPEEMPMGTN